ncbi:MAG: DUF1559 domain-containing protein [Gemmataceae bacterium]
MLHQTPGNKRTRRHSKSCPNSFAILDHFPTVTTLAVNATTNHNGTCRAVSPSSDPTMFAARSRHTGGVNVSMGDGSCRVVSETIDIAVWRAISSMEGGEKIGG